MIQHTEHGITGSINDLPPWGREPGMGFIGALTAIMEARKVTETTPVSTPVSFRDTAPVCLRAERGFLAAHTNTPLGVRACVCSQSGKITPGVRYEWLEVAPSVFGTGGTWEVRPEGKPAWREVEAESMQIVASMTGGWWPHTDVEMRHPVLGLWHVRDGKILSMSLKSLSSRIFRLPVDVPPDNE